MKRVQRASRQRFKDAQPYALLGPPVVAVVDRGVGAVALGQVAPRRARAQDIKMPLITRRSSTRGTPRGLFGSNGAISAHSASVTSWRRVISKLQQFGNLNHTPTIKESPFMGTRPSPNGI